MSPVGERGQPVGWGILGTGSIAARFAADLQLVRDARLVAVGSRSEESAARFVRDLPEAVAAASYAGVVEHPAVDVVYVATPTFRHYQDALLALEAGKAVLCEKPFCCSAQEAREVIDFARRRRQYCMEALWLRFVPLVRALHEGLSSGRLGALRRVSAELGYPLETDPQGWRFDAQQGGGALLDLGVYPLSLAIMLLGAPVDLSAQTTLGPTGVDEQAEIVLRFASGALAHVATSFNSELRNDLHAVGVRGQAQLHASLLRPQELSWTAHGAADGTRLGRSLRSGARRHPWLHRLLLRAQRLAPSARPQEVATVTGHGLHYQARAVVEDLRAGRRESPVMPLDHTLITQEILSAARAAGPPPPAPAG